MSKALIIPVGAKSLPAVRAALQRLRSEIKNAPNFEALSIAIDLAAQLHRRWKPVKEAADEAGEVWTEGEVRFGKERAKVGIAKGTRGQLRGKQIGTAKKGKGRGYTGRPAISPPVKDAPTIKELGVSKRQAARARKLFEMAAAERKRLIKKLKAENAAITPNAVLAAQRAENKQAKKHRVATAKFSADGPFGTVIIDPPWEVEKIDRDVRPNQDQFAYKTMSEAEIVAFWKGDMVPRIEPDCHLFMWTTNKFLPIAFRIIEAIGFRYVLTMVWHKAGGFQPVGLPQYNCEFAIYARQGAPLFIDTKDFNCCFEGERREHSRKPDSFYDVVRRVTGGSRIDVFSREKRDGFAQYGNEIDKFVEAAE